MLCVCKQQIHYCGAVCVSLCVCVCVCVCMCVCVGVVCGHKQHCKRCDQMWDYIVLCVCGVCVGSKTKIQESECATIIALCCGVCDNP